MKGSKDILLLAVMFLVLAVGLHYLAREKETKENKVSSSYNADPMGTKAFYTLLRDRLGYNADRLTTPFDRIPRDARVLIVVEPQDAGPFQPASNEGTSLLDWVERGGTLIYAGSEPIDRVFGIGLRGKTGKGQVCLVSSPKLLTNRGMRSYRNAVEMVALVAKHASKRDLILFDEYHHGFVQNKTMLAMLSRPVRMSLIVFALAALAAAYSMGRRFGAVREAPVEDTLRPGSEFVEAVGRLYRNAGATDVAAEIMRDSFVPRLYRKIGIAEGAAPRQAMTRLTELLGEERASAAFSVLQPTAAGHKPSEHELLHIAREIQQLEKELGLERNRS
jgi:hypothetical protein